MAVSHNTYLPQVVNTSWHLSTGEQVSLKVNEEVFNANGQLKGQARFSADKDSQLFTLSWPKLAAKYASTLSRWRLVITKATDDRIASFHSGTAENLGLHQWEIVKKVVEDCRGKFHARLLSMSCREIVFAHGDRQSAEKMKDSNEMVDIMNNLLADVEFMFCDIMVDWEVEVTPVTLSLSYQPIEDGDEMEGLSGSLILTDADSPPTAKSVMSRTSSVSEDMPPYFQKLLDMMAAENRKIQDTLAKMAVENTKRHRIVCQKMEELKNSMQQLKSRGFNYEDARESQSGTESDTNQPPNNVQVNSAGGGGSIPSTELFEGRHSEKPAAQPRLTRNEQPQRQQDQRESQSYQWYHEVSSGQGPNHWTQSALSSQASERQFTPVTSHRTQSDFSTQASQRESTTVILQRDSAKPSETLTDIDLMSGSDLENRNLDEAVERAYRHDDEPPPKAKSYYTILCLDVSESMKQNGSFDEMKAFVEQFINGVEDIVNETGVEENIGVVTFGGTSNVVQNLTNDFARVRDAIDNIQLGGRSPFVQALLVTMAAFVEKGGIISVSGVYDVRPRIIFVSDGYPTENFDDGGMDYAHNKMHVRTGLTRLMMNFASKEKYKKVQPIVYIPVGRNPDRDLMKSMATLSNGQYMETSDVEKLCGYFVVQETIGKALACIQNTKKQHSEEHIRALAIGLTQGLTDEQQDEVVKTVMQEQETPTTQKHKQRTSNFDDVYENTDKVNAGEILPLGTRVLRGPDWHWNDQDGHGPGTVFSHSDKEGWTYVLWDADEKGYNRYNYGPESGYDIWKTDDHPRLMGPDQELKIGMIVEKGPDWCYDHLESLQHVRSGVVIRKSRTKRKIMVRWDNAEMQVVRWGAENRYDVMYCDPFNIPKESPLEFWSSSAATSPSQFNYTGEPVTSSEKKPSAAASSSPTVSENGQWQWRDEDMNWNDYSAEDNAVIEKSYKRKPNGSCIVNRNGKIRRIMFRRMTEKVVDSGTECKVQRIPM